jgi:hypothetical protein
MAKSKLGDLRGKKPRWGKLRQATNEKPHPECGSRWGEVRRRRMKSAEWTVPQTGGGTILEFEQLASVPFLPFGTKFQGKHNGLSLLPAGAVSFASCFRSPSSGYPPQETIFRCRRKRPETKAAYFPLPSNGDCHVGPHPEHDLPRIPQRRSSRHRPRRGKAMTEVVTALFVFFSISVFLAHAFDAYRMR